MSGKSWLPTSDIKRAVAKRFPNFNVKERHKIAVLANRLRYLEEDAPVTHAFAAEAAALRWVLEELELMEE